MHVRPAVRHAAHLAEQLPSSHRLTPGPGSMGRNQVSAVAGSVQHGIALGKTVWRFPLKVKMQSSNETEGVYIPEK